MVSLNFYSIARHFRRGLLRLRGAEALARLGTESGGPDVNSHSRRMRGPNPDRVFFLPIRSVLIRIVDNFPIRN